MVAALSTGHEIGLAVAGALFVTFALLSSFVFPRRNPDFPTRQGLRWYVPLACLFFIGMMAAVLVFGREKKTAEAAPPAATSTAGSTTTGGSSTTPAATGDPAAGKVVFNANGCSACHTFKAAGSTGKVGPDLDQLADYAQKAGQPLVDFTMGAIVHPPPKYVPPGFPTNAMPATFGQSLSKKQLDDVVAFLTQPA